MIRSHVVTFVSTKTITGMWFNIYAHFIANISCDVYATIK